jgi:hypothetical protein
MVAQPVPLVAVRPMPQSFAQRITPLADLLSKGEGNWNSVNRGYAGDTPGGIKSVTGKSFDQMTIGQVMRMQRHSIYAVGRYQFIPSTLTFAIEKAGVEASERFTTEVQNRLLRALLYHKRPSIGAYLEGEHDNIDLALTALSKEWASIASATGRSYYAGRGGNAVHVTRHEAAIALRAARDLA